MNNPKIGNRVILLGFAIALAIASLFVQWGVVTLTPEAVQASMTINGQKVSQDGMGALLGGMMSSMVSGMDVPISGVNGRLDLGPLKIPYWLPVTTVLGAIVITILNSIGFSDFPRKVVMALLVFGILTGVWAMIAITGNGTIGVGALLLIAAAVIGISQQTSLGPRQAFTGEN